MDTRLGHIGPARRALQPTRRPWRWTWVWVLLVVFVNVGLTIGMVLTTDQRLIEIERRIELAMQGGDARQGELATAWSELGTEVVDLRGAVTELRAEAGVGDADLRYALDALKERVDRIEGRVAAQWQPRANAARGGSAGATAPRPVPGPRAAPPEFDGPEDEQTPIW